MLPFTAPRITLCHTHQTYPYDRPVASRVFPFISNSLAANQCHVSPFEFCPHAESKCCPLVGNYKCTIQPYDSCTNHWELIPNNIKGEFILSTPQAPWYASSAVVRLRPTAPWYASDPLRRFAASAGAFRLASACANAVVKSIHPCAYEPWQKLSDFQDTG